MWASKGPTALSLWASLPCGMAPGFVKQKIREHPAKAVSEGGVPVYQGYGGLSFSYRRPGAPGALQKRFVTVLAEAAAPQEVSEAGKGDGQIRGPGRRKTAVTTEKAGGPGGGVCETPSRGLSAGSGLRPACAGDAVLFFFPCYAGKTAPSARWGPVPILARTGICWGPKPLTVTWRQSFPTIWTATKAPTTMTSTTSTGRDRA